jgi:hypothetical protein
MASRNRQPTPGAGTEVNELATGVDPRSEEALAAAPGSAQGTVATEVANLIDAITGDPIFGFDTSQDPVTNATLTSSTTQGVPKTQPVVGSGPTLEPDLPDKDAGPLTPPSPVNPGSIRLARPEQGRTADQLLWTLIRNRTNAIAFNNYFNFVNAVLCEQWTDPSGTVVGTTSTGGPATGADPPYKFQIGRLRNLGANGFQVLKDATELFLMHEAGIIVNPFADPTSNSALQKEVSQASSTPPGPNSAALQQMYDPFISPDAELVRRNFDALPTNWVNQLRTQYYDLLAQNVPVLPYFTMILDRLQDLGEKGTEDILTNCYGVLPGWVTGPLAIELIWSYWHEEGMLAQAFNAISNRFENRRLHDSKPDPLARLEIDPLRRLNHYIWGWIQQEPFRLSVRRRAFEYDHEYGLALLGKAVGYLRGADTRSKFLEALHNLLYTAVTFHLQDDDLTVQADGFPVLNALRETQLVLTEGSHNQYGDLPWVARVEMMMMQWMLGRPEMREFLGGRVMVPYIEPWMDRVDTVKSMLDWTPTNVTHFRDLGVFGEQVLLSVRYGGWAKEIRPEAAANWCRYWRPEIQGYVHAYRAVSGVDLRQGVDATLPGVLLQRRLASMPKGRESGDLRAVRRGYEAPALRR